MDLPIRLQFFRKLELFQELKSQNKQAASFPDFRPVWKIEKIILIWAYKNHHNPSTAVTGEFIRKTILKNEVYDDETVSRAISNLSTREHLVKKYPDSSPHLLFTREGLLMGEVIYETLGDFGGHYDLLYWLIWATVITGALTVIINFFKLIYPYISQVHF